MTDYEIDIIIFGKYRRIYRRMLRLRGTVCNRKRMNARQTRRFKHWKNEVNRLFKKITRWDIEQHEATKNVRP